MHVVLRLRLPNADPYLFPLVAVLACFGLVMIYRIDETLAREQAQWFVAGLAAFAATVIGLGDHRRLERYRYVIALTGIALLLLPRVPGIGQQVNGAYLGVDLGPVSFQPAELAKIAIVVFLASYLRDTRQMLVQGARRIAGVTLPPLKHLGPLLMVWGLAMLLLVFIRDLGSSLMFFGGFLALIYVATNRLSFAAIGLAMFAGGTWFFASTVGHVQDRIATWQDPFDDRLYEQTGGSYQIAQSIFAQADGGLFGEGIGQSLLTTPEGTPLLPVAETDLIYAVITSEVGLFGAVALLCIYLLIVERGFKTALLATDSFSKLLATGLTAVLRSAGLRDRGRRHQAHPADRGHAALHLLRGLVDRCQLHPARAAAAGLRARARGREGGPLVNAPIIRLFAVFMVLFAGLVGATSWWTVLAAESAQNNPKNKRDLLKSLEVRRGAITSADGTELARSVDGPGDTYVREYPSEAETVSHVLGYFYPLGIGDAGTERFRADALSGESGELDTLFEQIAGGRPDVGDDVRTNLDLDAQRVAIQQLGGRKGAVVALDPDNGRVQVMASVPGYDPATLGDEDVFTDLATDEDDAPLINRATQSGYPPGSTFKVLTAAAALDSGEFTPSTTLDGSSPQIFSATPLSNFGGQSFGPVTLTQALTQSINTVWAEVGVQLGAETMTEYMEAFGLFEQPPLDYPDSQLFTSGTYLDTEGAGGRELVKPTEQGQDLGRIAIGQAGLLVTPLQMAMITATVANDGVLMEPRIAREITDRDGRTVDEIEPERVRRVMSEESANELTAMMRNVVQSGSGVAAALEGTGVAGKTGTAEIDIANNINQLWFVAFAPADDPRTAIAVTVERAVGGQGGQVAAPIARAVLESLLD